MPKNMKDRIAPILANTKIKCIPVASSTLLHFLTVAFFSSVVSACAAPATATSPVNLRLAPQVCENATEPGLPPYDLPYRPYDVSFIQGGTVEDGDFLFDLWLYCYSPSEPDPADQPSAIEGLGIYGGWYYGGPKVEGLTQDYWGFEPNVSPASGSTGPLYKAKTGYRSGITMSQEEIIEYVNNETPFRFQGRVESPAGTHGAVLQFNLELTPEGYVPTNVTVEPLNK